jgi:hypothetical protein
VGSLTGLNGESPFESLQFVVFVVEIAMLQLNVEYVSWECMLFYEVHINQIERIQRLRMTDMHGLSPYVLLLFLKLYAVDVLARL